MVGPTRSQATEFGASGITVNSVVPGGTAREKHGLDGGEPTAAFVDYRRDVPLARFGMPGDIGGAVAFLASEAAGLANGQRLSVNGGKTRI